MGCLRKRTSRFKSLDLTTEGRKKEKLLRLVGENEMVNLGVIGILGLENFVFDWQKECCEAEFVEELDLNE